MGSSTIYDMLGLIGSFIIAASLVPQVVKTYRTKSADDISYSFVALYIVGLALTEAYGFGYGLWPIYIPVALELLGHCILCSLKLRYDGLLYSSRADNSVSDPSTPVDEYHGTPDDDFA